MYGHTDWSGIPKIIKAGSTKILPVKFIRDVSNGLSGDNLSAYSRMHAIKHQIEQLKKLLYSSLIFGNSPLEISSLISSIMGNKSATESITKSGFHFLHIHSSYIFKAISFNDWQCL